MTQNTADDPTAYVMGTDEATELRWVKSLAQVRTAKKLQSLIPELSFLLDLFKRKFGGHELRSPGDLKDGRMMREKTRSSSQHPRGT